MKRNFGVWLTLLAILLVGAAFSPAKSGSINPHAPPVDQCEALPLPDATAVAEAPGWSLLRLDRLEANDRSLWNARRPEACPGFTDARLSGAAGPSYAIALVRLSSQRTQEEVILLFADGVGFRRYLLAEPHSVANPAVVWRTGPGEIRAWDGGRSIRLTYDSIILETIEATARQFYFVRGQMRSVITSE